MSREKTEISDESLWKLFETSTYDLSSQSVLKRTQAAVEAIASPGSNNVSTAGERLVLCNLSNL